jgi:hypothetical protein
MTSHHWSTDLCGVLFQPSTLLSGSGFSRFSLNTITMELGLDSMIKLRFIWAVCLARTARSLRRAQFQSLEPIGQRVGDKDDSQCYLSLENVPLTSKDTAPHPSFAEICHLYYDLNNAPRNPLKLPLWQLKLMRTSVSTYSFCLISIFSSPAKKLQRGMSVPTWLHCCWGAFVPPSPWFIFLDRASDLLPNSVSEEFSKTFFRFC